VFPTDEPGTDGRVRTGTAGPLRAVPLPVGLRSQGYPTSGSTETLTGSRPVPSTSWGSRAGVEHRVIETRPSGCRPDVLPLSLMPHEYRRCELNAVTSRYKREAVIPDGRRHESVNLRCSGEVRTRDQLRMKEPHYHRAPLHRWGGRPVTLRLRLLHKQPAQLSAPATMVRAQRIELRSVSL
jgi:hypothetical protein